MEMKPNRNDRLYNKCPKISYINSNFLINRQFGNTQSTKNTVTNFNSRSFLQADKFPEEDKGAWLLLYRPFRVGFKTRILYNAALSTSSRVPKADSGCRLTRVFFNTGLCIDHGGPRRQALQGHPHWPS